MCNNCIHKIVCSKYIATGGVKSCEHFKEERKGRWDDFADKYDKLAKKHDFRCSVCNDRASVFVGGTEDWWDMWKPDYCPNCGADMRGNENG